MHKLQEAGANGYSDLLWFAERGDAKSAAALETVLEVRWSNVTDFVVTISRPFVV